MKLTINRAVVCGTAVGLSFTLQHCDAHHIDVALPHLHVNVCALKAVHPAEFLLDVTCPTFAAATGLPNVLQRPCWRSPPLSPSAHSRLAQDRARSRPPAVLLLPAAAPHRQLHRVRIPQGSSGGRLLLCH